MTTPKLAAGKIIVPSLTDSQRLRQEQMRNTQRSASTHDSCDRPLNDLEDTRLLMLMLKDRIDAQGETIHEQGDRIAALEARRDSSGPPGAVDVKSPSGWRIKGTPWVALTLAFFALVAYFKKEIGAFFGH